MMNSTVSTCTAIKSLRLLTGFLAVTAIALAAASCSSRYRLELFMTAEETRSKVDVDQTDYFKSTVIADPKAENKLTTGPGDVVVLTINARDVHQANELYSVLKYNELITARVYLQFLDKPKLGSLPLPGNSFVHLLGEYDKLPEDKLFLADSGTVVVDSITSRQLFGTLHGQYKNPKGTPLLFDGRFKVKIR